MLYDKVGSTLSLSDGPLRQVPFRSVQHVLVALQYEEASSYSILIKCNICDFILWIPPWL